VSNKTANNHSNVYDLIASRVMLLYFYSIGYIRNCEPSHDSRRVYIIHTADATRVDRINSEQLQCPNFRLNSSTAVVSSSAIQFTLSDE